MKKMKNIKTEKKTIGELMPVVDELNEVHGYTIHIIGNQVDFHDEDGNSMFGFSDAPTLTKAIQMRIIQLLEIINSK
tara:strand:- start:9029 stop:9259 length:231 start_codon:yes stop_codon:yes gene_type:complete